MASVTGTFSTVKIADLPNLASPAGSDGIVVGSNDAYKIPWATFLNILTSLLSVDATDSAARALINNIIQVNSAQQSAIAALQAAVEDLQEDSGSSVVSQSIQLDTAIIERGTVNNISVNNNATVTVPVTFTKNFTEPPIVVADIAGRSSGNMNYSRLIGAVINNTVTTTGFSFYVGNTSGATRAPSVNWIAIQPTVSDVDLNVTVYELTQQQVEALAALVGATITAPAAMTLYQALTQILSPYAERIRGLCTGYDGTTYASPQEAMNQQISDLHDRMDTNQVAASAVRFDDTDTGSGYNNVQDALEYAMSGGDMATASDIADIIAIIEGRSSS